MIQRNPLVKATSTVFLFWYAVLFVPAWLYGAHIFQLPQYLLYAIVIMAAGAMFGFFIFLGLSNIISQSTEQVILDGGRFRALKVKLGVMPQLPTAMRASIDGSGLDRQPWWQALQANFPVHARAVRAVMEVMRTRPELPASPVPGGHGGRTLVEHSMAVAREIVGQAKTWVYEGQKDRRGKIRVALQRDPHRFGPGDIGLLILTGLAHDIGKMACYEDAGRDSQGRPLVREAQPNHDTAGARLLRTIPEVMELPYADRTALLLAVGYYHHPYALPRGNWITDRMRSLTELLIIADVETGKKEGHTLTHDYGREETEYSEDPAPSPAVAIPLDDEDEGSFFALAPKESRATPTPSQKPAPSAPAPAQRVETEQLPYELDCFLRLVRKDGAINGMNQAKRIAWKVADRVYVMEPVLRRQVAAYGGLSPSAAAEELAENNGNAAPFTAKLLEQLHQRGALVTNFDGQEYAAVRAVFVSVSPKGSEIPVFIVKAEKVPGASSIRDVKPVNIRKPLWGQKRPKATSENLEQHSEDGMATAPPKDEVGAHPYPPAAPLYPASNNLSDADLPMDLGGPASPKVPLQDPAHSTCQTSGMDDDDLPFALPAQPPVQQAGAQESEGSASATAALDPDALRDALPTALTQLLSSPDWQWPVETIEKDYETLIVVDVDSDAGEAITAVLQRYQEHGVPIDRVRIMTRKTTQKRAYVWPKMA